MNKEQPNYCSLDLNKPGAKGANSKSDQPQGFFKRILAWLVKGAEANAASCSS